MLTVVAALVSVVVVATTVVVFWWNTRVHERRRRQVIEAGLIARTRARELERWAAHERRLAVERARARRGRPAHRAGR